MTSQRQTSTTSSSAPSAPSSGTLPLFGRDPAPAAKAKPAPEPKPAAPERMKIHRAHKIRLDPTDRQATFLREHLEFARRVWNWATGIDRRWRADSRLGHRVYSEVLLAITPDRAEWLEPEPGNTKGPLHKAWRRRRSTWRGALSTLGCEAPAYGDQVDDRSYALAAALDSECPPEGEKEREALISDLDLPRWRGVSTALPNVEWRGGRWQLIPAPKRRLSLGSISHVDISRRWTHVREEVYPEWRRPHPGRRVQGGAGVRPRGQRVLRPHQGRLGAQD